MRTSFRFCLALGLLLFLPSFRIDYSTTRKTAFPYQEAGLTEAQAAAHLLNRFTYGPTPGQVSEVIQMGLENWFQHQLESTDPDPVVQESLKDYDIEKLSNTEISKEYLRGGQVLRMAIKDGAIDTSVINKSDKKAYRDKLQSYLKENGLKPENELIRQFVNQKVIRATYSTNQVREVLTEFWFNHFNVSFTKNDCRLFIPNYERDVIRPHVFGDFETLLRSTAQSPAMLMYLDNFTSIGEHSKQAMQAQKQTKGKQRLKGLNENYARELMELHTLGVDGGYTQSDVTQAARVLTGWTIYPMTTQGPGKELKQKLDAADPGKMKQRGFVHDGDFFFTPNRHDTDEKVVLGKRFPSGGGYNEGVALLQLLAHHPSTAKFISQKLAVRFVSDTPPQTLIDKLSDSFLKNDGNLKAVIMTMVTSPEFWSTEAVRQKTKSPFELTISSLRSLNARVLYPNLLATWSERMGQKLYFYQAPTGYPDRAQYWINTGTLLTRMNFGLALAGKSIPGVSFDLLQLNQNHEPEGPVAALTTYTSLLLPERDPESTIRRLTPLLNDPELATKVKKASENSMEIASPSSEDADDALLDTTHTRIQKKIGDSYSLAQVVGIILGSPEFQRR